MDYEEYRKEFYELREKELKKLLYITNRFRSGAISVDQAIAKKKETKMKFKQIREKLTDEFVKLRDKK